MSQTAFLAKNTAIQAGGKILSTIIGVLVVGIMTRTLGQEGFGLYSTANAYFQVAAIVIDLGLNVMIVQLLAEQAGNKKEEAAIASGIFTLRTATAFVSFTLSAVIGLFLPYPPELKAALFAIWGSFFFTALSQIVIGIHQRHGTMLSVAAGEVLGRLIVLAGIAAAAWAGWGLVPMVLIVSLGNVTHFAVAGIALRRVVDLRWAWDLALWKRILARSWPIGASVVFNLLYYKADTLVLSFVRPFEEVGLYGAAYRVLDILITLPFMYCGVMLPLLSRAVARKDPGAAALLLRQSFLAMAAVAAPMVAGGILLSSRIMTLVAGPEFAAAGPVLDILLLATAFIFLSAVSSYAIVALDLQRKMLRNYALVAFAALALYILLIPRYGMFAAAGLTVASEAAVLLLTSRLVTRSLDRHPIFPWVGFTKIAAAAGIMALVAAPLRNAWLPLPILAGAIAYGALLFAFGLVTKELAVDLLRLRGNAPASGDDPLP